MSLTQCAFSSLWSTRLPHRAHEDLSVFAPCCKRVTPLLVKRWMHGISRLVFCQLRLSQPRYCRCLSAYVQSHRISGIPPYPLKKNMHTQNTFKGFHALITNPLNTVIFISMAYSKIAHFYLSSIALAFLFTILKYIYLSKH